VASDHASKRMKVSLGGELEKSRESNKIMIVGPREGHML
jgi:hypothetical protein